MTVAYKRLGLTLFLGLSITDNAAAKPWRGIVPLTSTRADVLRILGKPSREDYIYDLDEGTVRIMYARREMRAGRSFRVGKLECGTRYCNQHLGRG